MGFAALAAAPARAEEPASWAAKLVAAAEAQVGETLYYDPAYVKLGFPGGDVPRDRGVCTDVVIRAYRDGLGIDLQQLVHADMGRNFAAYPKTWGLKRPDANIDHRRVANLQMFFTRMKSALAITAEAADYGPGDVVSMMLPGHLPHVALVTHHRTGGGSRPLCVHNIGAGARLEDVLFSYPLTGHYRFKPS